MRDLYHVLSVILVIGLGAFISFSALHKARRAEYNKPYLLQMGLFEKEMTRAEQLLALGIIIVCLGGMMV